MLKFVLEDIWLEYDPEEDRFRHPRSGEWVDKPVLCLRGWREEDDERRRRWGRLVHLIDQFRERVEPEEVLEAEEVDFTPSA